MNKFSAWKNILLLVILLIGAIYAFPNIFPDNPSVQISSSSAGQTMTQVDLSKATTLLNKNHLQRMSAVLQSGKILIRFHNIDAQAKAKEVLTTGLGQDYTVAITLAPSTPAWLRAFGATPMRMGLDLRGGVNLLLQVNVADVVKSRQQGDLHGLATSLRQKRIRYNELALHSQVMTLQFRQAAMASKALDYVKKNLPNYLWKQQTLTVSGTLTKTALQHIRQYTIDQTRQTIQRRVDALGVSNATVQQAGLNRISVDLPGIQDATLAQEILGKTATLEFHLVDTTHNPMVAAANGMAPAGTQLYTMNGRPILLKSPVILSGQSITSAASGFGQNGQPSVNIRVGGTGETLFYRATSANVNKALAVVYIETKSHPAVINGKETIVYKKIKRVINVANIQSALGASFQVTNLSSTAAAKQLALLLRAGALIAPVTIVADHTVGPSMGAKNVKQGMLSIEIGLLLVVGFMLLYYRLFGLIADIGLIFNLILLVAVLSVLGNVLTFAGIAGIVLTIGMAIDANVLIFERIREELRNGVTAQAAINLGYEKAFGTIIDSNATTFIAAIVLFSIGSGAIKGFAICLSIGLVTSVFTSVTYTRAIVNVIYGGRRLKHLPIGIKVKTATKKLNKGEGA
jgi:preprotein translocase subunit SecD